MCYGTSIVLLLTSSYKEFSGYAAELAVIASNSLLFLLIFTGRNEVVAKVIFLHLSVIHSVHRGGGGLPQCMLGYPPNPSPLGSDTPPDQTPTLPPWTRQTPPGRHPPWDQANTPPGPGRHPPRPGRHPPGPGTPPGSRLQHTVYERPVRILLECILVFLISTIFSLELRRPVVVGAMDDFERRCLRKKRQVFVEHVEISAELLENMKAKGLLSREHVEHILVSAGMSR